jgi:hypothetical protein
MGETHTNVPRMNRAGWLVYGALATAFCSALWQTPLGLGISDWDYHLLHYAIVLRSLFACGQLPFWNPRMCGGNALWQNPQVALVSSIYQRGPLLPWIGVADATAAASRVWPVMRR